MRIKPKKSIETVIGPIMILSGVAVIAALLGYINTGFEEFFVWMAAIGSIVGGLHILITKVKHAAIRKVL